MLEERGYVNSAAFPLSRLIYCLVAIILAQDCFGRFATEHLLARQSAAAVSYSFRMLISLPVVSGIVVSFLYRPFSTIFYPVQSKAAESANWPKHILYGIGGGLIAFVLSISFLLVGDTAGEFVAGAISHATSVDGLPMLMLLVVVLPIVMEVVFRGITFRTLSIHANAPCALLASSLLFAYVWPSFGRPIGVILGIVSGLLYFQTKSLLPSILANATLSLSGGIFILYRALTRH